MGLDVVDIWIKPRCSEVMSLIRGNGMESHPRIWQHSLTKSPTTCLNRIRRALT